uniref:Platelet-activating factor acetylhydrolase IB subunit alpha2 n=1 Tax=Oreochromis aureus TaxID=47969 RepID=A0AAZ1WX61_OREAU
MSGDDVNPAAVPQPVEDVQGDGRWLSQHSRFVQECKDAEPDVLFVGDSMVQLMHQYEVWRELFSPLHALNFGIGGDTTCNVLWRLQNGELENIRPKVVVLWVGTNNYEHTAEQVAGGILAIAELLTTRLPKAKIVVLGLLPRGERPNPLREKNAAVNAHLRSWLPRLSQAQLLDVTTLWPSPSVTCCCRFLRRRQRRDEHRWFEGYGHEAHFSRGMSHLLLLQWLRHAPGT